MNDTESKKDFEDDQDLTLVMDGETYFFEPSEDITPYEAVMFSKLFLLLTQRPRLDVEKYIKKHGLDRHFFRR